MSRNLEKHLGEMHRKAMQIDGLVTALNCCIDEPDLHSVCVSMVEALASISPVLLVGLDTPQLREG